MSRQRVTIWRPLIRRKRLIRFIEAQAERMDDHLARIAMKQLASNLRSGMSLGIEADDE